MSQTDTKQQTRILVQAASAVCDEKKAQDTRILELDAADSGLTDFFLVTSATNDRQAQAIADEIEFRLKKQYGVMPNSVEGRRVGEWILLDYVDFVVHVFLTERRAFYDIERLRKSARPFSPAEFEGELKAALSKKTVSARKKAEPKAVKKAAAKKAAAKPAVKKAAAKKTPAKTTTAKKAVAKAPAKKAAAKPAAKKAVAKKAPVSKTAVKKTAVKKAAVKKAAVKKVVTKAPAKKAVKKAAVKKKR